MDLVGKRHILTKKTAPYVFISPFFILLAYLHGLSIILSSVVLSFHDVTAFPIELHRPWQL